MTTPTIMIRLEKKDNQNGCTGSPRYESNAFFNVSSIVIKPLMYSSSNERRS